MVAVRRAGEQLVVANLHAESHPEISFSVDPHQARAAASRGTQLPDDQQRQHQREHVGHRTSYKFRELSAVSAATWGLQCNRSHAHPLTQGSACPAQEVDTGNHSWANYFLAAYKAC